MRISDDPHRRFTAKGGSLAGLPENRIRDTIIYGDCLRFPLDAAFRFPLERMQHVDSFAKANRVNRAVGVSVEVLDKVLPYHYRTLSAASREWGMLSELSEKQFKAE